MSLVIRFLYIHFDQYSWKGRGLDGKTGEGEGGEGRRGKGERMKGERGGGGEDEGEEGKGSGWKGEGGEMAQSVRALLNCREFSLYFQILFLDFQTKKGFGENIFPVL